MTKTFPEVISGIRTARKGVEVREDIAQMGEYVEQFASTATTKASEAEKSAERAKNAVDGIDQQKADAVKAVQQAQATAINAVANTKNAALREVANSTTDARSAASAADRSATAAAGSASTASGAATTATTKAGAAATSATQADASQKKAAENQQAAEDAANRAAAIVSTDKALSFDGAPADAKAVGDIILDRTKDTPEAIFYSKAEVDAKIKEAITAALSERDERDHDVGSFYVSNNPTSPAQKYGGTWERIEGKFIMGASDAYPAGSTGGEATVALSESNNGPHSHYVIPHGNDTWNIVISSQLGATQTIKHAAELDTISNKDDVTVAGIMEAESSGLGTPHNNIPPYYSMYIWRRAA